MVGRTATRSTEVRVTRSYLSLAINILHILMVGGTALRFEMREPLIRQLRRDRFPQRDHFLLDVAVEIQYEIAIGLDLPELRKQQIAMIRVRNESFSINSRPLDCRVS